MNELKQRIAELCPDVMELKKGCFFLVKDDEEKRLMECLDAKSVTRTYGNTVYQLIYIISMYSRYSSGILEGIYENNQIEILGSPITLAVVFRAMEKMNMIASCDTHGNIGVSPFKGHVYWNLAEDRLEDQTPECIAFLKSILGV